MKQQKNSKKDIDCSQLVLEAYFSCRTPNDSPSMPDSYAEERKTTQQIQDELLPSMCINKEDIVIYMAEHGYILMPGDDGTPVWLMYRLR